MKQFFYLILFCAVFAGCKGKSDKKEFDPSKPTVSVTIEPFRYFVEQIAGDDVNVNVMVPAGSNPETYEPTAQQMVQLSQSILYFKVGKIGFETTWMKKLQQNAKKMKVIDTSAGIELLKTKGGNFDPHTWMSIHSRCPDGCLPRQSPNLQGELLEISYTSQRTRERNGQIRLFCGLWSPNKFCHLPPYPHLLRQRAIFRTDSFGRGRQGTKHQPVERHHQSGPVGRHQLTLRAKGVCQPQRANFHQRNRGEAYRNQPSKLRLGRTNALHHEMYR